MQSLHPDRKITVNDILDRSWLKNKKRWRNNNRLRKKFANRWIHYVSYEVYAEVMGVLLSAAIRPRRNYDELSRRAFKVEPLPAGALRACSSASRVLRRHRRGLRFNSGQAHIIENWSDYE